GNGGGASCEVPKTKRASNAPAPPTLESLFPTVPNLYRNSVTLSSYFYRFGYFLAVMYSEKAMPETQSTAD
ncbi:MAG: hypothetical protein ABIP07_00120, partial [Sphingomicrobium sp.]